MCIARRLQFVFLGGLATAVDRGAALAAQLGWAPGPPRRGEFVLDRLRAAAVMDLRLPRRPLSWLWPYHALYASALLHVRDRRRLPAQHKGLRPFFVFAQPRFPEAVLEASHPTGHSSVVGCGRADCSTCGYLGGRVGFG